MKEFKAKIVDPMGLHARPATIVIKKANTFESKIEISTDEQTRNMKSIMHVMALGASQGCEIKVTCDGPDEAEACSEIEKELKDHKLI